MVVTVSFLVKSEAKPPSEIETSPDTTTVSSSLSPFANRATTSAIDSVEGSRGNAPSLKYIEMQNDIDAHTTAFVRWDRAASWVAISRVTDSDAKADEK